MTYTQQKVYDNVEERGYRQSYSEGQFLLRNICKMQEELGELNELMGSRSSMSFIEAAMIKARALFRNPLEWLRPVPIYVSELEKIRLELADMQVVLFCMAQVTQELDGQPFDVAAAALEKSSADVARGVS